MSSWHLHPSILVSWLALMGLLTLTVFLAYRQLGELNTFIALAIATAKGLIVAAIFMELREPRPLTIIFAAAGFFWLAMMFWLTATDFAVRPNFPPAVVMERQ